MDHRWGAENAERCIEPVEIKALRESAEYEKLAFHRWSSVGGSLQGVVGCLQ